MPTYEYLCQACSHRFETWQKMAEEPLTTCPKCGQHIRRVLYPAGIVFKGSGFYKTDHGNGAIPASNDNNNETKKADDKSTANNESKSSDKSPEGGTSTKSSNDSKAPATTATAE